MLNKIKKYNDIKKFDKADLDVLAKEIRSFLIDNISKTGGHLASNLGVVELTMALHLSLDLPCDKIIWDVGHQAYTHKLLTGRRADFTSLRTYGGISGFPKRRESYCDAFDTGHSSTSISAGLGIVNAMKIKNDNSTVVSVIGDGALTGGMAFEALNNAANLKRNFIIILNDNNMSISKNVGGISTYLSNLRAGEVYNDIKHGVTKTLESIPLLGNKLIDKIRKTKSSIKQLVIPGMLFENMGITYLGPVDGHDVKKMTKLFDEAKKLDHAVIIHVLTKKGKGFKPAETHPEYFHGVEPFDKNTGLVLKKKEKPSYTDVFSSLIVKLAKKDEKIVAVTAAMPEGTGLKKFSEIFPDRFFDVGIAEEHAVTFAAGLASQGLKPFVAIYSSFLQRAYDQILHDVCIQDLPVKFIVDRAGLVGADGETHQGIFDISYLSTIPNMNILCPKNKNELRRSLEFAVDFNSPIAIRYPRGEAYTGLEEFDSPIIYGKSEVMYQEKDIAILAVGDMNETALKVREMLKNEAINVTLINVRFVKPFDQAILEELIKNHYLIVTLENNVLNGSYGEKVHRFISMYNYGVSVLSIGIPNQYVEHGSVEILKKDCGIDPVSVYNKIKEHM